MNDKNSSTDFSLPDSSIFSSPNASIQAISALLLLSLSLVLPSAALAQQAVDTKPAALASISPLPRVMNSAPIEKPISTSREIKEAALSIIQLVSNISPRLNSNFIVNVPAYNFAGVLQELQNRHAKFMPSPKQVPKSATTVFTLQTDSGMSQTVYFTE